MSKTSKVLLSQSGMTLMSAIIGGAVSVIILGGISSMMIQSLKTTKSAQATIDAAGIASTLKTLVSSKSGTQCPQIFVPTAGSSVTLPNVNDSTSLSQLMIPVTTGTPTQLMSSPSTQGAVRIQNITLTRNSANTLLLQVAAGKLTSNPTVSDLQIPPLLLGASFDPSGLLTSCYHGSGSAVGPGTNRMIVYNSTSASNGDTSSNGTYTYNISDGVTQLHVRAWGPGGSGGTGGSWGGNGSSGPGGGGGGGSGGFIEALVSVTAGSTSLTLTVGQTGTATSIGGTLVIAGAGSNGSSVSGSSGGAGGTGGTRSTTGIEIIGSNGSMGTNGIGGTYQPCCTGGYSLAGRGGSGGIAAGFGTGGGTGGSQSCACNAPITASTAGSAVGAGGGGGAGYNSPGAAGAAGRIIIQAL